jgi:uncharacterized protein YoaH (UPF0181 family)
MCPACVASAGLVVGSVISTGGVTALVAKILRRKKTNDSKQKEQ